MCSPMDVPTDLTSLPLKPLLVTLATLPLETGFVVLQTLAGTLTAMTGTRLGAPTP